MHSNKTFIETQFPVSKLSKESYKERKANQFSQMLTGLGKWWGRKPLILVRAILLGILMPTSDNVIKDCHIFLKILTMDNEGLWLRKSKSIPLIEIYNNLSHEEQYQYFEIDNKNKRPRYKSGITSETKKVLQRKIFESFSYDKKLRYCSLTDYIDGPCFEDWKSINEHLNVHAQNVPELFQVLGKNRFGHISRVGDVFCGGGSIPFEASRMGFQVYGTDLNPVAALLTWAAINIVGGSSKVKNEIYQVQKNVYNEIDNQMTEWGIEHNERGWRADSFVYCLETKCPECEWLVPLLPNLIISSNNLVIARLIHLENEQRFDIKIIENVSHSEIKVAKINGTIASSRLICPHCNNSASISSIRGDKTPSKSKNNIPHITISQYLRLWENNDIFPQKDDIFQERLYCIRWVKTIIDDNGKKRINRYYRAPTQKDYEREETVRRLVTERLSEWQNQGLIPIRLIESGDKTSEPIKTRGWTHWHHLFNPRQLLIHGLIAEKAMNCSESLHQKVIILLWLGLCCNFNSKISRWEETKGRGLDAFSNQALNTLYNYACRGLLTLNDLFNPIRINPGTITQTNSVILPHNYDRVQECDIWITDPPYADAINYHELSEFFLAWYEKHLTKLFPDWYTDSKRALAIKGSGSDFRKNMVACYRNLANHMPDNGLQVVMFTHQDSSVWADLALILWASGLRVTAAWTIATETESALKAGNYVQGTVLMVLRKQTSEEVAFLDEIFHEVDAEVETQLKSMLDLDDKEDPNFTDSDYQLAAYAAALRVLTQYKGIEDIDISHELSRESSSGEPSPIEKIIDEAVKTASNYLIPHGLDEHLWKSLSPEEKFYLKGLEVESHGDYRNGVYQEFARGFGVREYRDMLESGKANQTRLKTASEFRRKELGDTGFGTSLLRNALFAVFRVAETEETQNGLKWLKDEVQNYWQMREALIKILRYLASMAMEHWKKDAEAAHLLAGAVENDHI